MRIGATGKNCFGMSEERARSSIEGERQVYGRWTLYFNQLLTVENVSKPTVLCMGMDGGCGGRKVAEERTPRDEVHRTFKKIVMDKAPEICGEVLKNGGDVVVEWITWVCSLAWESSRVLMSGEDIKVSFYKHKGIIDESVSFTEK